MIQGDSPRRVRCLVLDPSDRVIPSGIADELKGSSRGFTTTIGTSKNPNRSRRPVEWLDLGYWAVEPPRPLFLDFPESGDRSFGHWLRRGQL